MRRDSGEGRGGSIAYILSRSNESQWMRSVMYIIQTKKKRTKMRKHAGRGVRNTYQLSRSNESQIR
jgi:hypothetical protein